MTRKKSSTFLSTAIIINSIALLASIIALYRTKTVGAVIAVIIVLCLLIFFIVYKAVTDKKINKEIIKAKEEEQRLFQKEKEYYTKLYGNKTWHELLPDIPKDVYFDEKGIPIKGETDKLHPYGEYTVYTAFAYRLHKKYGCSRAKYPAHIFAAGPESHRCQTCFKEDYRLPEWYKDYCRIMELKKKYEID